jgi:hypothetical protein
VANPPAETELDPSGALVMIGTVEQRQHFLALGPAS